MKKIKNSVVSFAIVLFVGLSTTAMTATFDLIVYQAQKTLQELEYDPGSLDGIWGSKTERAVKEFQLDNGLTVNGQLDEETKKKLGLKKEVVVTLMGKVETEEKFERAVEGTDYEVTGNVSLMHNPRIYRTYTYITVTEARREDRSVISEMKGDRFKVVGEKIGEVQRFDGEQVQVKGTIKEGKAIYVTTVTEIPCHIQDISGR